MQTMTVGVRKLRNHFTHYLRLVEAGEHLLITNHGRPIGQMTPIPSGLAERLNGLKEVGRLDWNGEHLMPIHPVGETRSALTLADLVSEDRD